TSAPADPFGDEPGCAIREKPDDLKKRERRRRKDVVTLLAPELLPDLAHRRPYEGREQDRYPERDDPRDVSRGQRQAGPKLRACGHRRASRNRLSRIRVDCILPSRVETTPGLAVLEVPSDFPAVTVPRAIAAGRSAQGAVRRRGERAHARDRPRPLG